MPSSGLLGCHILYFVNWCRIRAVKGSCLAFKQNPVEYFLDDVEGLLLLKFKVEIRGWSRCFWFWYEWPLQWSPLKSSDRSSAHCWPVRHHHLLSLSIRNKKLCVWRHTIRVFEWACYSINIPCILANISADSELALWPLRHILTSQIHP